MGKLSRRDESLVVLRSEGPVSDVEAVAEDPAEVEAAWAEEIKARIEEIRNGTAELYDLDDVLAEMEERYG